MITSLRLAGAVLGTVLAGSSLTVAPVQAATLYHGQVHAVGGLQVRYLPTTTGKPGGVLPDEKLITIVCKVRSTSVNGNNIWYELMPTSSEFVAAAYVENLGPAPRWCGRPDDLYAGRSTATLTKRVGPTTAEAARGSLRKGSPLDIICKIKSEKVAGTTVWYFLTDGSWASAAYIRREGTNPVYCR